MKCRLCRRGGVSKSEPDLGFNKKTGRIGVLFADHLADFYAVMETKDGTTVDVRTAERSLKMKKGDSKGQLLFSAYAICNR